MSYIAVYAALYTVLGEVPRPVLYAVPYSILGAVLWVVGLLWVTWGSREILSSFFGLWLGFFCWGKFGARCFGFFRGLGMFLCLGGRQ